MKKIYSVIILLGISFLSFANKQGLTNLNSGQLKKTNKIKSSELNPAIINIGVGWGIKNHPFLYGEYQNSPAISFSYEKPYPKKIGPGYLAIGFYTGYRSKLYKDYNASVYSHDKIYSNYTIAARAVYYLDFLNSKNASIYFGVASGAKFQSLKNNENKLFYKTVASDVSYLRTRPVIGFRYRLFRTISIYGELGQGQSIASAGVSINL